MKIAVITEGWPANGTDSIYLNSIFRKESANLDIIIITTSKDGIGVVEGINNTIVYRVESVPQRINKLFFDEVNKVLAYEYPDVIFTLTPVQDFHPINGKVNIAHWTATSASDSIQKDIIDRYHIHTTFTEKHKLRLLAQGVDEKNIFAMAPITGHATFLSILANISTIKQKKEQEVVCVDSSEPSIQPITSEYIHFIDKGITVRVTPRYETITEKVDVPNDIKWRETTVIAGVDLEKLNIDVPEEHHASFFDVDTTPSIHEKIINNNNKTGVSIYSVRLS